MNIFQLRYKSLKQVPSIYKCRSCQQVPQNPVFDINSQCLICQRCLPRQNFFQKRKFCQWNSLSELQIQLLNGIEIKCQYCQNFILGKKLQQHSLKCQQIISIWQLFFEQQLQKFQQTFFTLQCQKCICSYCEYCPSQQKCCGYIMQPIISEEIIQLYQGQVQCIYCEKQFEMIGIHQHFVECLFMQIKCYCGNHMTRMEYRLHVKSCLTNRTESLAQTNIKVIRAAEILVYSEYVNSINQSNYTSKVFYLQFIIEDESSSELTSQQLNQLEQYEQQAQT